MFCPNFNDCVVVKFKSDTGICVEDKNRQIFNIFEGVVGESQVFITQAGKFDNDFAGKRINSVLFGLFVEPLKSQKVLRLESGFFRSENNSEIRIRACAKNFRSDYLTVDTKYGGVIFDEIWDIAGSSHCDEITYEFEWYHPLLDREKHAALREKLHDVALKNSEVFQYFTPLVAE